MGKLTTNKYSINYDLEFINTKENALKALSVTTVIWNVSLIIIFLMLFRQEQKKINYPLNFNFLFCFILILLNFLIVTKRHFLIFFINKIQRLNETKDNKLTIISIIGLLLFTTILGIFNTLSEAHKLKSQYIINAILIIGIIVGFLVKSKSVAKAILKQITLRDKENKKQKLQKYHDSLLIVNNLPTVFAIIISFIIVTSKALTEFDCIILYLFNVLTFFLAKPQKQYFLQYCPKCFQIRSLGLSAYSYCPNCKREEWNNTDNNEENKEDKNNNKKK